MPVNSRRKGKRGELLAAALLREHGFHDARRGKQYSGDESAPDVIGIPNYHLEIKNCERGSLHDWLRQAHADCGLNTPIVLHKRKRSEWVAILDAGTLLNLIRLAKK
jgi:hypothetical protein